MPLARKRPLKKSGDSALPETPSPDPPPKIARVSPEISIDPSSPTQPDILSQPTPSPDRSASEQRPLLDAFNEHESSSYPLEVISNFCPRPAFSSVPASVAGSDVTIPPSSLTIPTVPCMGMSRVASALKTDERRGQTKDVKEKDRECHSCGCQGVIAALRREVEALQCTLSALSFERRSFEPVTVLVGGDSQDPDDISRCSSTVPTPSAEGGVEAPTKLESPALLGSDRGTICGLRARVSRADQGVLAALDEARTQASAAQAVAESAFFKLCALAAAHQQVQQELTTAQRDLVAARVVAQEERTRTSEEIAALRAELATVSAAARAAKHAVVESSKRHELTVSSLGDDIARVRATHRKALTSAAERENALSQSLKAAQDSVSTQAAKLDRMKHVTELIRNMASGVEI